jgi:membrane-anchored protein YejM (alkaline phosphatase superfamily)
VITVFVILIWFGKEERWTSKENCIQKIANYAGFTYFLNMILGAAYILSWTVESGFYEWLSVLHLLLASLTFLLFASTLIIINIHGNNNLEEE